MMDGDFAIRVEGLVKRYGAVTALDGISFDVRRGELFGLIGPDGAGKTTLFRLLATLLTPDAGRAEVDGRDIVRDVRAIRSRVGYMPGRFSLYPDLSVEENLAFFAALFGVGLRDNYGLIEPIYRLLEPFRTRRAGKLSGGMKQKLALCCALIHRPSVLLLDEPTTGVDPVSRGEFWEMLARLRGEGISILAATPYMDEARRCDRVALCDRGRLLAVERPDRVAASFGRRLYALSGREMYALLGAARSERGVEACYPFGAEHHLTVGEGFDPEGFRQRLLAAGFHEVEVRRVEPGIEDVFIRRMNHE